jgi:rhamnosyltransferase
MDIYSKKIAIILATYNGEKWMRAQLLSIMGQECHEWHIFIRDDGSSDQTLMIANMVVPQGRLTILDASAGPSGSPAGNFFAALAQVPVEEFDYVCFCDQDDIWAPDKLSRAISCMNEHDAAAYSSDLIAFDNGSNRAWYLGKSQPPVSWDYLFQGASAGCTYVLSRPAAALVKEKTLCLLGKFPKSHSHDWLTYAICRSHGMHWHLDRSAHIYYRQHSNNAYGSMPGVKGQLARLKVARSGWYRNHVLWLRPFLAGTAGEWEILDAVERDNWRDRLMLIRRCSEFRRSSGDAGKLAIAMLLGIF